MSMKSVLIICDVFPPVFAPRMGYLYENLQKLGWQPLVITEYIDQQLYPNPSKAENITYIKFYKAKHKYLKKCEWLWVLLLDYLFDYKTKRLMKIAREQIKQHDFSLMLTSTYRTFPIYAAHKLSKEYHLPLVVDLRDIVEQYTKNEFIAHFKTGISRLDQWVIKIFKKKLLSQRNKVLRAADHITTVSPWHVETLRAYNPNVSLIYNGYDEGLFYPKIQKTPLFVLTYTGRVISLDLQNPELLFQAVKRLKESQQILPSDVRIRFYTDRKSKDLLQPLSEHYGITPYVEYLDMVPHDQVAHVFHHSSILLLLTNKSSATAGPKGIMTTKFFEYLAVGKPILCVTGDEDCLEQAIDEAKAGVSAHTLDEVSDFMMEKYTEWKQNGYTSICPNTEVIRKYNRFYQAQQFEGIFNSLSSQNHTRENANHY